jgi:hypothetical protein
MPAMNTSVFARRCRNFLSVCALLLASCGDSDVSISSQTLSGKVGGKAWSFATGQTNPDLSEGDSFWAALYASRFAACETSTHDDSTGSILLSLPKKTGKHSLGLDLTVTFFSPPGDNLAATRGSLEVTEITDTTIKGGLNATYDGDNSVDGQFTVSICP